MAGEWGVTPKESVLAEIRLTGLTGVVERCLEVLSGRDIDDRFLFVLAGPASRQVLQGREGGPGGYWPKVWALRGLLYAWDDSDIAQSLVIAATADESWRVREMAAKVISAHRIDAALDALGRLADDPVPRVRSAAVRARVALTESTSTAPRGRRRRY